MPFLLLHANAQDTASAIPGNGGKSDAVDLAEEVTEPVDEADNDPSEFSEDEINEGDDGEDTPWEEMEPEDLPEPVWPEEGIATRIPVPSNVLSIAWVNTDFADIQFMAGISMMPDAAADYLAACRTQGFCLEETSSLTEEPDSCLINFKAFDADGYRLMLTYWGSTDEI